MSTLWDSGNAFCNTATSIEEQSSYDKLADAGTLGRLLRRRTPQCFATSPFSRLRYTVVLGIQKLQAGSIGSPEIWLIESLQGM
jgi:hypothetical protein